MATVYCRTFMNEAERQRKLCNNQSEPEPQVELDHEPEPEDEHEPELEPEPEPARKRQRKQQHSDSLQSTLKRAPRRTPRKKESAIQAC